jgi:uncharacterized membrane protein YbhN (UPF0104 family)
MSDDAPFARRNARRLVWLGLLIALALVFLYVVLPRLSDADNPWERLKSGDRSWLVAAGGLELLSYGGYVILFRAIFARRAPRIRWRESYLITMAGVAATRLLATAGAGGIALTAWALRRSGMERREVGASMTTFMVLLYAVFFASVLLDGILLRSGALPGPHPVGLTIVPAVIAGIIIAIAASAALIPRDLDRRWGNAPGWFPHGLVEHVGAAAVAVGAGVSGAIREVRGLRPGLVGAVLWWAGDVATLWACFHAFGTAPPVGVIVMGYFVGQVGNTLPLPGGIGGVEGGMIGAFAAFGVSAHLALVSVLAYRAFAFWLPTVPGGLAYFRLTRIVRGWDQPNNVTNGDAAPALIADDAAAGRAAEGLPRGG